MLLTFIAVALVLTFVGLALVAWGLLKKRTGAEDTVRREANLTLLRRQFSDLEADHAAGRVTDDEYAETKSEIERRVLEETTSEAAVKPEGKKGFASVCVLAVLVPVCAFSLYEYLGAPEAFDPEFLQNQAASHAMGGHTEADLEHSLQLLEERLKDNPDNLDGWVMLAKTYASFKNWKASSRAYEQVNRLAPKNADVLADWADVMAAAEGSIAGKPEELIREALAVDPKHWKALALMGTLCFDREDFKGAVTYWERMREGTEQGSEEWRQITENIDQARRLGGLPPESRTLTEAPQAKAEPVFKGPAEIMGTVELAPELKARVKAGDTLFVFARPVKGSKMPVAFVRLTAADLPVAFKLDAMSQMGMGVKTLADVREAVVEARISRSGNFMPSAGDLEGAAGVVKVGAHDVKIVINRAVP